MKKFITKMILVSFILLVAVTLQAAIISVYDWSADSDLAGLSVQPQSDDLTQRAGSKNQIMKGGMVSAGFSLEALFNSNVDGSYGPAVLGQMAGIFQDGISPTNDTVIHCDFAESQTVYEVHIFTKWGDQRLFSWFEVWASNSGTNDGDYSYLGTTTFGEIDDAATAYLNSNCVARLYDPDDNVLAENVTSIKLIQKNSGYDGYKRLPGTNVPGANIDSCACVELDIIGPAEITTITNEFFWNDDLASLPVQPLSDDLAQGTDATNMIIAGGMHTWPGLHSNYFENLFNSPVNGELGAGCPETVGGTQVILYDPASPDTLSLEMYCNFTTTKMIEAVHVFSRAGDARLFTYAEVSFSTNWVDYSYIGAVSFGDWGDSVGPYSNKQCVANLYNSDTNEYLAENIVSLKLKFRSVADTTYTQKVMSIIASAIGEVDILGIDGNLPPLPPPLPPAPKIIYVGKDGTSNGSNYFTVIQDAVDVASDDTLILVSNGVYNTGGTENGDASHFNRVDIDASITLQSVSGPESTFIVGERGAGTYGFGDGATRCVELWGNYNAKVIGFTLTNGYTSDSGGWNQEQGGGGIYLRDPNVVSNCIIVDCYANGGGGGALVWMGQIIDCEIYNTEAANRGGAIFCDGQLTKILNCNIHDNYTEKDGGAIACWYADIISNCVLRNNEAGDRAGGVWMLNTGDLYDCNIYSNTANNQGGGFFFEDSQATVNRCKIYQNEALGQNGGGLYIYHGAVIRDSLIYENQTIRHGGGIFFDNGGEAYNCTIVANSAMETGGGINLYNVDSNDFGKIVNSIIYTNIAFGGNNNWGKGPGGSSPFNCTGPIAMEGDGNISNNPEFVSIELGDWHLMPGLSPCINAGTNGEVTSSIDLDGEPRIEGENVDMGCYEAIPEPILLIGLLAMFSLLFFRKK